jgi:sugar lactone lactonase YvrE
MNGDIRTVVAMRTRVGEGPVWDAEARRLHWVDILAGDLHTTEPDTGRTTTISLPTLLGAAVPRAAGGFVAAMEDGFAEVDVDGTMRVRAHVLRDGVRMNDAKCDPTGRLWAGSTRIDFTPGEGALHVLEPDWTTRVVLHGLTLPNGLGWSPDGRTFYLVDSMEGVLWAFDTELASGTLGARRELVRFKESDGLPDGLCVDAAGCLWLAMWGGGRVLRIAPDGAVLEALDMPVVQPSSCAFGGAGLDVLFVTSAAEGLSTMDSLDGSLFAVAGLGHNGVPAVRFGG